MIQTQNLGDVTIDIVTPFGVRVTWQGKSKWTTPAELKAAAAQDWSDVPGAADDYARLAAAAESAFRARHPRWGADVNRGWGIEPWHVRDWSGQLLYTYDDCKGHSPYAPMPYPVILVGYGDGTAWLGRGHEAEGWRVTQEQAERARIARPRNLSRWVSEQNDDGEDIRPAQRPDKPPPIPPYRPSQAELDRADTDLLGM